MKSGFNYWDMLIGFGYGALATVFVLRFSNIIPQDVSKWGQLIFFPTIGLQIFRQAQRRRYDEANLKRSK